MTEILEFMLDTAFRDFGQGAFWILSAFLLIGLFFLMLSVFQNFEMSLLFTMMPLSVLLTFKAINTVYQPYVIIIVAMILAVPIYRLFQR